MRLKIISITSTITKSTTVIKRLSGMIPVNPSIIVLIRKMVIVIATNKFAILKFLIMLFSVSFSLSPVLTLMLLVFCQMSIMPHDLFVWSLFSTVFTILLLALFLTLPNSATRIGVITVYFLFQVNLEEVLFQLSRI